MDTMLDAIEKEIEQEKEFLDASSIESVYFGGGTPSMIGAERIGRLLEMANATFQISSTAEITLEANPEDIEPAKLEAWKKSGVNRLSLGIQSLVARDLEEMNRNHNAVEARKSVDLALNAGFKSLNVDLIFGSPWLDDAGWQKNLNWAFQSGADHISAYALTVEPKTMMNRRVNEGKTPAPSDETQARQYKMLYEAAGYFGWDFYEISNLSKPMHRAIHNSNYWKNLPYLGFGPSAHSFSGNTRRWNISDNKKYIDSINSGKPQFESETLGTKEHYNEYLLTNIRTVEGVHIKKLASFGLKTEPEILKEIVIGIQNNWVEVQGEAIKLTLEGRLLADYITSEWMV